MVTCWGWRTCWGSVVGPGPARAQLGLVWLWLRPGPGLGPGPECLHLDEKGMNSKQNALQIIFATKRVAVRATDAKTISFCMIFAAHLFDLKKIKLLALVLKMGVQPISFKRSGQGIWHFFQESRCPKAFPKQKVWYEMVRRQRCWAQTWSIWSASCVRCFLKGVPGSKKALEG